MSMVHNWKQTCYRRRSGRVFITVAGARALLNSPLTECDRCPRLATYGHLCLYHWQEQVAINRDNGKGGEYDQVLPATPDPGKDGATC